MPIEVLMPALSPTMEFGTLAKWVKNEGDSVESGDVIAEIETDKATMEVEAVDEGTIGKIIIAEGTENVPVNNIIALLLEEGEEKSAADKYEIKQPEQANDNAEETPLEDTKASAPSPAPTPTAAPAVAPQVSKAPSAPSATTTASNDKVTASPVAKRIANEAGINLSKVRGTGPKGRITKSDVEEFIQYGGASGGSVARNAVEFETEKNSGMRKVVAKRLLESKQQIPHFYLNLDIQLDDLLKVRAQINEKAANQELGYKISVNDFIIKASALAMKDNPIVNTSWYDDATVKYNNVDISVAVAIEGGLLTPIVQNADQKSLPQISNEMKDLAKRARGGELAPEEYTGGGFSISNLGMYGIKSFNAIVNPPQSAILAVGAGEKRAIVNGKGELESATVMTVTLSCDHRTVDGAVGAEFLNSLKAYLEKPALMLV